MIETKWFNDLKEKYEETTRQAKKTYLEGIFLYLQEKLKDGTSEEFEFLKDYAERHGKHLRSPLPNLVPPIPWTKSEIPEDYEEIEVILDSLSENLQGSISPPLTQADTLLAVSILGKLEYKQCMGCKKWFDPEKVSHDPKLTTNYCPECKKKATL